jgi:hypothetical protein
MPNKIAEPELVAGGLLFSAKYVKNRDSIRLL